MTEDRLSLDLLSSHWLIQNFLISVVVFVIVVVINVVLLLSCKAYKNGCCRPSIELLFCVSLIKYMYAPLLFSVSFYKPVGWAVSDTLLSLSSLVVQA